MKRKTIFGAILVAFVMLSMPFISNISATKTIQVTKEDYKKEKKINVLSEEIKNIFSKLKSKINIDFENVGEKIKNILKNPEELYIGSLIFCTILVFLFGVFTWPLGILVGIMSLFQGTPEFVIMGLLWPFSLVYLFFLLLNA